MVRLRKNYFDSQKSQQRRHKESLIRKLEEAQDYARQIGLEITQLILRNQPLRSSSRSKIDIIVHKTSAENESIVKTIDKQKKEFKCLVFKDKTFISNLKYRLSRRILDFADMPSLKKVIELKEKIDKLVELRPINHYGVFVNVKQKITFACKFFLKKMRIFESNYNVEKFIIKISCDGTIITKSKVNILNVSFTIINDKKSCKTAFGNFILGKRDFL